MSFTAAYPGACADCGEEIQHTEVAYRDGALVHVQCPGGAIPLHERPEAPLCPRCFCWHRGEC